MARLALGHQGVDGLELAHGRQRALRIDMADAEHGRWKQRAAVAVTELERYAREVRHVGVARAVDKARSAYRLAAGLGFHHQGADAIAFHHHGRGPGVEKDVHPGGHQQLVGRAFVGRHVIGAHADTALHAVLRCVQAAQRVNALKQVVGDAAHHLPHLAVLAAVKAREIGDAAGRAHAAQETVALDQQVRAPWRAALTLAARPAGPPPTTTTSNSP